MCLICGHVGCGRYREGHAAGHSKESGHAYALELEAQRVWDYSSDNYVHRLVQSKTHGKLVELPSPAPSSSERNATQRCAPLLPQQCRRSLDILCTAAAPHRALFMLGYDLARSQAHQVLVFA